MLGHPDRVLRSLVGGLALDAPRIVGEQDIVDMHGEVVATEAEVRAVGEPGELAPTQDLPLCLINIGVEGLDQLLTAIVVTLDTQEDRLIRALDEGRKSAAVQRLGQVGPATLVHPEGGEEVPGEPPAPTP